MTRSALTIFLFAASFAGAGCNHHVITESAGGGGDGGGGGTTTTTGPADLCQAACQVSHTEGCTTELVSQCASDCLQTYQDYPDCAAQMNAYAQCTIEKVPGEGCSNGGSICGVEFTAVWECMMAGCQNIGAWTDETGCITDAACNGVHVQADCGPEQGTIACTCYVQDTQVGTCVDSELTCGDIEAGCCAQFF